jgi:hypothetical protein
MDTPEDRLTILERAQLLHDATLRRHGEMLDTHADRTAQLVSLMEQQVANQTELKDIAAQLAQRQEHHDAVMQHLAQTLDAIKDLLERRNGRP